MRILQRLALKTRSTAEEVVGKRVSNGLPNKEETEELRKALNDTKSKHLLLNTAASRKRLKDLNGSKRGTVVTQLVTKNFSMNGRGTLALF